MSMLQISLGYGAVLSFLLSVLIIGSLALNAEIWLHDYPPDVRQAYGPPRRPETQGQKRFFSLLFFGVLALSLALALRAVYRAGGGELGFAAAFISTYIILMFFNLVDLLVVDWLILGWLRPKFAILPGTEGMAGYSDYGFALRGFFKGTLELAVMSAVIAGLAVGIGWLVG